MTKTQRQWDTEVIKNEKFIEFWMKGKASQGADRIFLLAQWLDPIRANAIQWWPLQGLLEKRPLSLLDLGATVAILPCCGAQVWSQHTEEWSWKTWQRPESSWPCVRPSHAAQLCLNPDSPSALQSGESTYLFVATGKWNSPKPKDIFCLRWGWGRGGGKVSGQVHRPCK